MLISVITCTRNPKRHYFQWVLDALAAQTLPKEQWEYLIIDNASDHPIQDIFDVSWKPGAKVVREERVGLTPARLRALEIAAGELIVFVDDDNVLSPNYLEAALMYAESHSYLGAWSGQCFPEFETSPPEWTRPYWGTLCLRQFETEVWSNMPRLPDTMPAGAGMCLRRQVAHRYLWLHDAGLRAFQLDRAGDSLISGGDNDLAACACDIGLGVGLTPVLKLRHLISKERLTEQYLERLVEGIYFSSVILAFLRQSWREFELYSVRPRHRLRALLNRGPHRRMQLAVLRGRTRGLRYVADVLQRSEGSSR